MICPNCNTQYDVYNAVDKKDWWYCPICDIKLNDADLNERS